VVDAVCVPEVPVMVTVYCPVGVELPTVSASVLDVPLVGFGVKVADTPLGKPEAARLTLPLNPYWG
jgi:hypothetical protein